jgi:hypothetical protein
LLPYGELPRIPVPRTPVNRHIHASKHSLATSDSNKYHLFE